MAYDLQSRKIVAKTKQPGLGRDAMVCLTNDHNRFVFFTRGGDISIIDNTGETEILHGIFVNGEVVIYNPDGRFVATEDEPLMFE